MDHIRKLSSVSDEAKLNIVNDNIVNENRCNNKIIDNDLRDENLYIYTKLLESIRDLLEF